MFKLVDFYAPWCAPCRDMSRHLDVLADEFAEMIVVEKRNIEVDVDMATEAGVRSVPTLILYEEGVEVARRNSGTLAEVRAWLEKRVQ